MRKQLNINQFILIPLMDGAFANQGSLTKDLFGLWHFIGLKSKFVSIPFEQARCGLTYNLQQNARERAFCDLDKQTIHSLHVEV